MHFYKEPSGATSRMDVAACLRLVGIGIAGAALLGVMGSASQRKGCVLADAIKVVKK